MKLGLLLFIAGSVGLVAGIIMFLSGANVGILVRAIVGMLPVILLGAHLIKKERINNARQ